MASLSVLFALSSDDVDAKGKRGGGPRLVASDTGASPNPVPFWGRIGCQNDSRHQLVPSGGDPAAMAVGSPQGNGAYRRLTVFDGDDYWGERCELGETDDSGPVAFYREGKRRITYASFRLPANFPLGTENWQGVLQMKQAGSDDNESGAPVLSLSAYRDRWQLWHSPPRETLKEDMLWSAPARAGVWTRFAFDVRYSKNKKRGWITVFADLSGDLDFADPGERSATFRTNTLKVEIAGTASDGYRKGDPIPSHLRVGIYHDDEIPCVAPSGCSVDVDNVQVLAP